MKKITVLLLGLLPLSLFAQYTASADAKFQPLNKSAVTTDILYDRVYPMAELTDFNHSAADTSQVKHFYNAWAELQTADYTNRWNTITTLRNHVGTQWAQDKVAIGMINVDFEVIDDAAIEDNLLAFSGPDSLLTDVPGRPRSPYLKRNALVLSPLQQNSNSTTVTFVTGNNFRMQAASPTISSLQADFGNGQGYQSLSLNGSKTVTFPNTGMYYIKFKVNFSNGSTRYTYGKIRINSTPYVASKATVTGKASSCTCAGGTIFSSRRFRGYDEPQGYEGSGEFTVFQGGSALDRPVIVLDGFDPFEGEADGVGIPEINNFLIYSGGNLLADLTNQDFDVIPLNFTKYRTDDGRTINGGTDYIERNAMVLIDLITKMRGCKTGSNPIKVIGFSMGGLVARYALRYMEQNGIPHDTDLFVSVDAPHNGATVPVGIQEIAAFLDDLLPLGVIDDDIDTGVISLTSPAAKQMLAHHYLANSKTTKGAPNFHDRFYNTLNSMGFPQQTRNISVVDGVATGVPINVPGQKYLDFEMRTGLLFLIGGRTKAKLNYAPNRGLTRDVMNFKVQLKLLLIRITLYKRIKQVATSSVTGSYENSPGGFYPAEELIFEFLDGEDEFNLTSDDFLEAVLGDIELKLTNSNFSFIPVKSGLAFSGSNQDLYEDFSERDLVCTGETPFDTYFTATTNAQHIQLNSNSANFIEQEIRGVPQPPNVTIANNNIINGPELICNGNTVYSLTNCSAPGITWSASANLTIVGSTATTVTVRPATTGTSGNATISGSFAGQTVEKEIYVGKPEDLSFDGIQGNSFVSSNSTEQYYVPVDKIIDQGYTNYYWSVSPASTLRMVSSHMNRNDVFVQILGTGMAEVNFHATNPCGSTTSTLFITIFDGGGLFFSAYPNPAGTTLTIEKLENVALQTPETLGRSFKTSSDSFELYNFNSELVMSGELKEITNIDVSALKKGTYILRIRTNDHVEAQKIIIQ